MEYDGSCRVGQPDHRPAIVASMTFIELVPFPGNLVKGDRGVTAALAVLNGHQIQFTYRLAARMADLVIPGQRAAKRTDRLWEHTCFEAFIRPNDSSAYYEFNFSPSGEWATYAFGAYRESGALVCDDLAPNIRVQSSSDRLELEARFPLYRLPLIGLKTVCWIALAAVVESVDGALSYWALKHPSDKPDFHHHDSFALQFALGDKSAWSNSP